MDFQNKINVWFCNTHKDPSRLQMALFPKNNGVLKIIIQVSYYLDKLKSYLNKMFR